MNAISRFRLIAVLFLAMMSFCMPACAQLYMDTYNLLVIPVDFADDTGTLDIAGFYAEWIAPINDYFDQMSNAQFTLNVTVVEDVIRLGDREHYTDIVWSASAGEWVIGCQSTADCRSAWSGTGNAVSQVLSNGDIEAVSTGLRPAGGGAGSEFHGMLILTAQGVNRVFPGWSVSSQQLTADPTSRRYAMAYAPIDGNTNGDFEYGEHGVAVHELGHIIPAMYTHPAGYISAYELMDSCYPCALGVFTRMDRSALSGSFNRWFSGWIDASHMASCSPPDGGTFVLSPIEYLQENASTQGLQVMTGAGYSYICELRRFIAPDDVIPAPGRLVREGVVILKATPGANPETWLMMPSGWDPADRWEADFIEGESFYDATRDVTIAVVDTKAGEGMTVNVTYGAGAGTLIPDVALLPWLSEPMNTYETVDIWVDNPVNGYEKDAPDAPGRLRYGRRADDENSVIGNGDDPAANEWNLVYARVRNLGTAAANNVVVHFEVTNPIGVGIRDDTGWTRFDTVNSTDFAGLASIAPGAFVDVYGEWRPTVTWPAGEERIPYHTCLRVIVDGLPGELVTVNQDGVNEQENVGWFEAPRPFGSTAYEIINREIILTNDGQTWHDYYVTVDSQLPETWELTVGEPEDQETLHYVLEPKATVRIPVTIQVPDGEMVGKRYFVDVRAFRVEGAPDVGYDVRTFNSIEVAGVHLAAQTVDETTLTITATYGEAEGSIKVEGQMTPPVDGAIVSVRYTSPEGPSELVNTTVESSGKFDDQHTKLYDGTWRVQALWAGDDTTSSAMSNTVSVVVGEEDGGGGCMGGTLTNTPPRTPSGALMLLGIVVLALLALPIARKARAKA
jgi:hypothetical protein